MPGSANQPPSVWAVSRRSIPARRRSSSTARAAADERDDRLARRRRAGPPADARTRARLARLGRAPGPVLAGSRARRAARGSASSRRAPSRSRTRRCPEEAIEVRERSDRHEDRERRHRQEADVDAMKAPFARRRGRRSTRPRCSPRPFPGEVALRGAGEEVHARTRRAGTGTMNAPRTWVCLSTRSSRSGSQRRSSTPPSGARCMNGR